MDSCKSGKGEGKHWVTATEICMLCLGILQVTYTAGRFMNGAYLVPYNDIMMLENG